MQKNLKAPEATTTRVESTPTTLELRNRKGKQTHTSSPCLLELTSEAIYRATLSCGGWLCARLQRTPMTLRPGVPTTWHYRHVKVCSLVHGGES